MTNTPTVPMESDIANESTSLRVLLTRDRWFEIGRIVGVGIITLLYWREVLPLPALWVAIAFGLYPLVKTGLRDLIKERKIGTEIFVRSTPLSLCRNKGIPWQ